MQMMLGHKQLETTALYAQVATVLREVMSPTREPCIARLDTLVMGAALPWRWRISSVPRGRLATAQHGHLSLGSAESHVCHRTVPHRGAGRACAALPACEHTRSPTTPAATATAPSARPRRRRWLEARQADLLPVEYFHVVFTLPAPISAIAYANKAVIYDLLFDVAAETLRTIAADPQASGRANRRHAGAAYLGLGAHASPACARHRARRRARPRRCSAGSPAGRVSSCRCACSRACSGGASSRSCSARITNGRTAFFGERASPTQGLRRLAWPLRQCEWVVYAKRPFAGPEAVLAYLSRYTHRVAISNSRLIAPRRARRHLPLEGLSCQRAQCATKL